MPIYMNIVAYDPSQPNAAFGDGSVRIACHNNLHQLLQEIDAQSSPGSIQTLQITAPGIIAVLIGLLLPAVHVREAANQPLAFHSGGVNLAALKVREAAILPYIEEGLKSLRPYFAHDGHVELRGLDVGSNDQTSKALTNLAGILGVPVQAGKANPVTGAWAGPITEGTPLGMVRAAFNF